MIYSTSIFFILFQFLILINCTPTSNSTTYIGIKNYKAPCKVEVKFNKSGNLYHDSDTLLVMHLNKYVFDSFLLRTNIDKNTYSFIMPANRQIGLRPMSLDEPISEVFIQLSKDSTLRINPHDKKLLEMLEKVGIVTSDKTGSSTSIYINIR